MRDQIPELIVSEPGQVLLGVPYDTPLDLDLEIIFPRECLDFKYLSLGQVIRKRNVDPKTIHNHRSSSEGI